MQMGLAWADVERMQAELDKTREEPRICTEQEQEHRRYIHRLTGFDPWIDPKDIEEALNSDFNMDDFIKELEREAESNSSGTDHG